MDSFGGFEKGAWLLRQGRTARHHHRHRSIFSITHSFRTSQTYNYFRSSKIFIDMDRYGSVNAGCELSEGGISGCGAVGGSNCVVGRTFLSGRTERGGEGEIAG